MRLTTGNANYLQSSCISCSQISREAHHTCRVRCDNSFSAHLQTRIISRCLPTGLYRDWARLFHFQSLPHPSHTALKATMLAVVRFLTNCQLYILRVWSNYHVLTKRVSDNHGFYCDLFQLAVSLIMCNERM